MIVENLIPIGDSVYYSETRLFVNKKTGKSKKISNIIDKLLTRLIKDINEKVSTEELVIAVYEEKEKENGVNNLYGHVAELRLIFKKYDPSLRIENTRGAYMLTVGGD